MDIYRLTFSYKHMIINCLAYSKKPWRQLNKYDIISILTLVVSTNRPFQKIFFYDEISMLTKPWYVPCTEAGTVRVCRHARNRYTKVEGTRKEKKLSTTIVWGKKKDLAHAILLFVLFYTKVNGNRLPIIATK